MKRELWMGAQSLIGSIVALNALFCECDDESQISPEQMEEISLKLSEELSTMQLEDALDIIKRALVLRNL